MLADKNFYVVTISENPHPLDSIAKIYLIGNRERKYSKINIDVLFIFLYYLLFYATLNANFIKQYEIAKLT